MQILRSSPAKEEKYIVNRNKQDRILTNRIKAGIHMILIIKMPAVTPARKPLIGSFSSTAWFMTVTHMIMAKRRRTMPIPVRTSGIIFNQAN